MKNVIKSRARDANCPKCSRDIAANVLVQANKVAFEELDLYLLALALKERPC